MSENLKDNAFNQKLNYLGLFSLLTCFCIAFIILIQWMLYRRLIFIFDSSYIPMQPVTSFTFILLCLNIFVMMQMPRNRVAQLISNILYVCICIIISFKLFKFFTHTKLDFQIIFNADPFLLGRLTFGKMSPITALSFLISSLSLYFLNKGHIRLIKISGSLITASIGINSVVLIGYLFRTPILNSSEIYGDRITPIAFLTAVCFILLGIAIITKIGGACFPLKPMTGPSTRARLLRAFVPLIFGFVFLDGIAYSFLPVYLHFNPAIIPALIALLFIATASTVIYRVANKIGSSIDRAEAERIDSEERLKESEARFRTLTEANFEGIIIHEQGHILDSNQAFADMFGYEISEVIGKSVHLFAAPESHEIVAKNIKSGYALPYEAIGLRKDGTTFPGELIGKILPYQKRMVRVASVRDISLNKLAEESLRESEQRYRLMFENNPAPMWVYDVNTLKFLDVNNALIKYYGYSKSEFLDMTIQDIHAEEDVALALLINKMSKNTEGINLTGEWKLKSKDGKILYTEIVSHAFKFQNANAKLVIANDITDRKNAEARLIQSEKWFRALVERSSDVYIILNQKGNVTYTAPSTLQVLGYQQNEYVSSSSFSYLHPEDEAAAKNLFSDILQTPGVPFLSTYRSKHKQGHWVWMEAVAINLLDDPNINGILINARDVTDKKRIEAEASLMQKLLDAIRLADNLSEALNIVLKELCTYAGWKLGEAWLRTSDGSQSYKRVAAWNYPDTVLADLASKSGEFVLSEASVLGEVWTSGKVAVLKELKAHPNFERHFLGKEAGIQSGLFFPVLSANKVVAVLDFFMDNFSDDDAKILQTITTIAIQLGLEIQRKTVTDRLKFQATILQHIGDGVITVDLNGIIVFWNQGATNIYGYQPEEVIGQSLSILYPEKSRNHFDEEVRFILKEGSYFGVRKLVHKDGTLKYVEVKITAFINESGQVTGLIGIQKDITEKRRFDEALKLSEDRFTKVFDSSPIGISIATLKDNKYINVNSAFVKITGLTKEEILGKRMDEISTFKDYINALSTRKANVISLQENGVSNKEIKLIAINGSARYLQVFSQVIMVEGEACSLSMINDISNLKKAETDLLDSEGRFQILFDEAPLAIAIFREGKIEFVNKAFLELFEYNDNGELKDKYFTSLFGEEVEEFLNDKILENQDVVKNVPVFYDITGYRKDQSSFPIHLSIASMALPDGMASIAYIQDVTDRAEAIQLLEASQGSLSSLIGNLPGLVYRCRNEMTRSFEFVSEGAFDLIGYSPSDILINKEIAFKDLLVDNDLEKVWEELQKAVKSNSSYTLKYKIRTKEGAILKVIDKGSLTKLMDGRIILEGLISKDSE
jgi:PAS domain S-box-containing protein